MLLLHRASFVGDVDDGLLRRDGRADADAPVAGCHPHGVAEQPGHRIAEHLRVAGEIPLRRRDRDGHAAFRHHRLDAVHRLLEEEREIDRTGRGGRLRLQEAGVGGQIVQQPGELRRVALGDRRERPRVTPIVGQGARQQTERSPQRRQRRPQFVDERGEEVTQRGPHLQRPPGS